MGIFRNGVIYDCALSFVMGSIYVYSHSLFLHVCYFIYDDVTFYMPWPRSRSIYEGCILRIL